LIEHLRRAGTASSARSFSQTIRPPGFATYDNERARIHHARFEIANKALEFREQLDLVRQTARLVSTAAAIEEI